MRRVVTLLHLVALAWLAVNTASADTLLSNFQQPNSYSASIGSGSPSGRFAAQFFPGSLTPVWNVTAFTLSFGGPVLWEEQYRGPILYSAYVFNGANNTPTTELASLGSFNFDDLTTSILEVTFNPAARLLLNANSEYWLVVGAVSAHSNGILEGTAGRRNDIVGSGWQYGRCGSLFNSGSFLPAFGNATPFLEIQATVPEPSIFALAGVAMATLYRRSKRR